MLMLRAKDEVKPGLGKGRADRRKTYGEALGGKKRMTTLRKKNKIIKIAGVQTDHSELEF